MMKKAIRVLGIAESFRPNDVKSRLAGIVMRSDLVIDGFVFGAATLRGNDATKTLLKMYRDLKRGDIKVILLSGCIISQYNIIDLEHLATKTGIPVICVTYRESDGIEKAITELFADDHEKFGQYQNLRPPSRLALHTGYRVYIRSAGLSENYSAFVVNAFTLQGAIPEPIRVARLLARAVPMRRRTQ